MGKTLEGLEVKIGIDSSAADKGMDQTTKSARSKASEMADSFGKAGNALNKAFSGNFTSNFNNSMSDVAKKMSVTRSAINNSSADGFGLRNSSKIGLESINTVAGGFGKLNSSVGNHSRSMVSYLGSIGNSLRNAFKSDNDNSLISKFENIRRKASETRSSVEKSSKGGFGFGAAAGIGMAGIQTLTGSLGSLISQTVSASDAMQKFNSTMSFAGFDNKQIKAAGKDAKKYADDTVYDLNTITNTTAQLAANGIGNYTELTQAAGNLNAVAGGNSETFKSVAMMLTQTVGEGKLTTENWNQLSDAIPGASGKIQAALRKNGVFTGNFRQAMADGKISADDFNKALVELGNTDVAKKAATSTNTFEGAIGNMQASIVTNMNNVIDNIGKDRLTDIINSIGNVVGNLVQFFANMVIFWQQNSGWLNPLIGGIMGAIVVLKIVGGVMAALTAITTAFDAALLPVVGIFLAIAAVIAIVIAVVMNWGTIMKWLGGIWTWIKEVVGAAMQAVGNVVKTVADFIVGYWKWAIGLMIDVAKAIGNGIAIAFNFVVDVVKTVVDFIVNYWKTVFSIVVSVVSAVMNGIVAVFQVVWDVIVAIFKVAVTIIAVTIGTVLYAIQAIVMTIFNGIAAFFSFIWGMIGGVVMAAVNFIWNTIVNVFNTLVNTVMMIFNMVATVISTVWNFITGIVSTAVNAVVNVIVSVFNAAVGIVSAIFSAIGNAIAIAWQFITSAVSAAVNAIVNVIVSVFNAVVGTVSSIFSAIANVAVSVWNGILNTISNIINGISSTISNVFNSIVGVVSGVFNGIKEAIAGPMNAAKGIVSGIINAIKGFFSFSIKWPHIPMPHFSVQPKGWEVGDLLKGKIPHLGIDWYANGGIMTAPTMFGMNGGKAMVGGEAGREAVLPLNKDTLGQIGAGIVGATSQQDNDDKREFNVTQNIYSHDSLTPRELERQARTELEKYARTL